MRQETKILDFMRKHAGVGITAKGLYRLGVLGKVPYTSVTRALNRLVNEREIRKTSQSVVEEFGIKNRLFVYDRS
jgi:hypothetical protein